MKKLLIWLLFLPTLIMADAVIFSGSDVKALKQNLDLFGVVKVMSGTVDPSTGGGIAAPVGSAYLSTVHGLFLKTGAGNTAWTKNALLPVDLTAQVTGILPPVNGGTGSGSIPTNGQIPIGNGTNYTPSTITGTANQVSVTNGAGSITLSTPQDIATTSNVQFANLNATGTTTLNSGLMGPLKASSGVVSSSAINLGTEVTGTLPIANGGTGSATQNFVDLTTNQTVAGEKTFSNTLKSDSIQTTGSSGVVIKNSSGTTVADFGPANTTNASIVGGLNVGGNVGATGNVTGANLSGTNTGDLTTGGDNDTPATTATIIAPNKQLTLTGTNQYRLNTGNANELENANFEHSTVTTGWTVSNATATGNVVAPFEGSKSLSLALTGALSLTQSSTINAARKSGVQMVASIFVKSDDVSDLQLCSLKNGAEDKCTVTGGYVQGTGWKQLTVSFLGDSTSNGLKLKSTDTSGTVLVDQAYVGLGSPIVNYGIDPESISYTGYLSKSGSTVRFKTLSDNSSGNLIVSNNATFTKYTALRRVTATACYTVTYSSSRSDTQVVLYNSSGAVKKTWEGFYIQSGSTGGANAVCGTSIMEIGDYFTANESTATPVDTNSTSFTITANALDVSKAYVASSSDYGWTLFTPTVSNLGTITAGDTCRKKKDGGDLLVECFFTTGTASGALGSITLPDSLSIDTTKIGTNNTTANSGKQVGTSLQNGNAGSFVPVVTATGTDATKVYFAANIAGVAALVPANGNATHFNSQPTSISFRVPISGWQDSSVIVGSFQGYNETPGTSRVETFSFSYGTTNATTVCSASPCSYLDQIGNSVSSVTRSGTGVYALNTSKTYSKIKCGSASLSTTGTGRPFFVGNMQCSNCSSISFQTHDSNIVNQDSSGTILCQGIPQ